MKKLLFSLIFLATMAAGYAQMAEIPQNAPDPHIHKGLYLSMSLGPVFPSISDEAVGSYDLKFKGTGAQFDLKIGGAVKENFILHATITSNSMAGPKVTSGGVSQNTSNNLSLSETMIGGGATYYFMPVNIFLSGSLGLGNFVLIDGDNDSSIKTDRGFSMQLKAGKEWWISRKWGLGVALTYGKTVLTNSPGGGTEEHMNSNNFGILFNATLN
jgi:hypothetical protein